jgi:hypothetical protein
MMHMGAHTSRMARQASTTPGFLKRKSKLKKEQIYKILTLTIKRISYLKNILIF